jgi:uncharacterized protein (TIGR00369 family)
MFEPQHPDYPARVRALFQNAPFVQHLGVELAQCGPGYVESTLRVAPHHRQQDGFVHAGLQATMADHTAGAAALTLMPAEQNVLSVECKIQLLRSARGERLRCWAEVLKPGSRFAAVEAGVWSAEPGGEKLVARLTATMACITPAR